MDAQYTAALYGINPGINTAVLDQRTATWLESKPGLRRRTRKTFTFAKLTGYEQTDSLLAIPGVQAHEDEVDGFLVMAFMLQGRCIGMWYNAAGLGTVCMNFDGDDLAYAGADPFSPLQDQ